MKQFILFFSISFFSIFGGSAVLAPDCALNIGGRCFTTQEVSSSSFKILKAQATTSSNSVFYEGINQTGYSVPTDKVLRILAIRTVTQASSGNIYYTDDDIGTRTATVGTNPVYVFNDGITGELNAQRGTGGALDYIVNIPIPENKYVNCNGNGAGDWSMFIYAIEEDEWSIF